MSNRKVYVSSEDTLTGGSDPINRVTSKFISFFDKIHRLCCLCIFIFSLNTCFKNNSIKDYVY